MVEAVPKVETEALTRHSRSDGNPTQLPMRVEVFTSIKDAAEVWQEAESKGVCYVFQSFNWVSAWLETIGRSNGVKPYIVRVVDGTGCTAMLLPLGIHRRFGCGVLSFLGCSLTDYNAPILEPSIAGRIDAAGFAALWEEILRRLPPADIISLRRMPRLIDDHDNPFFRLPGARHAMDSFSISLRGTFEDFRRDQRTKLWSDSRRQRRRLAKIGTVSFHVAATRDETASFTAEMMRQKTRWYRETGHRSIFDVPAYCAFVTQMTTDSGRSGLCHVSALRVNAKIVATHWGMLYRNRFYYLMPAYEGGVWRKYSAGRLLLEHLVEQSFANRVKEFDFTIGDEPYKMHWTKKAMALFELEQSRTVKGFAPVLIRKLTVYGKERIRRHSTLYPLLKRARQEAGIAGLAIARWMGPSIKR